MENRRVVFLSVYIQKFKKLKGENKMRKSWDVSWNGRAYVNEESITPEQYKIGEHLEQIG